MTQLQVGLIGCGNISGIYFKNGYRFANYRITAAADIVPGKAAAKLAEIQSQAAEWQITINRLPVVQSVPELLSNPDVDLVLNLTIPKVHAAVTLAALATGKHVYSEKPLAVTRDDGRKIIELAAAKNLRVGCAPDTFLGAGQQTCRQIIDHGFIGTPVAATAFMTCPGHESWHPDPEFYYQPGAGPMFDMGPYYLTALINLLGPATRISTMARATFPHRTITSAPKAGTKIKVETPTHITGSLEFASGPIATLIMSFDIHAADLPRIEIYGTRGTLSVPDPNTFGGPVKLKPARPNVLLGTPAPGGMPSGVGAPLGMFPVLPLDSPIENGKSKMENPLPPPDPKGWSELPLAFPHADNSRGLGVSDLAAALIENRPHRASADLALHVLDIMQSFLDSAATNQTITLTTTCDRPVAFQSSVA